MAGIILITLPIKYRFFVCLSIKDVAYPLLDLLDICMWSMLPLLFFFFFSTDWVLELCGQQHVCGASVANEALHGHRFSKEKRLVHRNPCASIVVVNSKLVPLSPHGHSRSCFIS